VISYIIILEIFKIMIKTESIKYIGAKTKLLPYILSIINNIPNIKTVLDGFAGTTRV
jgi:hypothetical protein